MPAQPLIYVRPCLGARYVRVFYLDLIASQFTVGVYVHSRHGTSKINITPIDLHTQIKSTDHILNFNGCCTLPASIERLVREYSLKVGYIKQWALANGLLLRWQIDKLKGLFDEWLY